MTDDKAPKEEKEQPETKPSGSIDDIAGGEMPEIKENAIAAVKTQKDNELQSAIDNGFDPEIHVLKDGIPQLNKNGTFKKKRGRKKGSTLGNKSQLNLSPKQPETDEDIIGSYEAAVTISGLLEQAQVKLISDEFIYEQIEREANIKAWQRTLDFYGGLKLTPPQSLVLSHLQIIITRAAHPENKKTKEKFAMFGAFVKTKFSLFKFKKKDKKKDGARSNSGKDSKRENNASNEDGKSQAKSGNKNSST